MFNRFTVGDKVRIKDIAQVVIELEPHLKNKTGTIISKSGKNCKDDEEMVKLDDGTILHVRKRLLSAREVPPAPIRDD